MIVLIQSEKQRIKENTKVIFKYEWNWVMRKQMWQISEDYNLK